MPEKDLTITQRATLLILMVRAQPVELRTLKLSLTLAQRNDLVKRKLITVVDKPYLTLDLTDDGWAWAKNELTAEAPEQRPGPLGRALYVLLGFLHDHFEINDLSAAAFFSTNAAPHIPEPRAALPDTDVDLRIREAYSRTTPEPGAWVMLADIREALDGVPKADVDEALRKLDGEQDIQLIPESNQKVLTPGQRAAAVRIGNQDMHLLAVTR